MKLIYILLVLILVIGSSCKRQLDIEPKNSITFKNGIRDEKDIQSLIGSVEEKIRLDAPFYPNSWLQSHMHYYNKGSQAFDMTSNLASLSSLPQTPWDTFYDIIHRTNIPLRYMDQTNMSQERKDYYKGQAYFYKAFAYLWLVRIWGDVMLIRDDVIMEAEAKTPWPIVLDYAIENAEKAVALLPEYNDIHNALGKAPGTKFTPSKGAANALLADLASWKAGTKYMTQLKTSNYDEILLWSKAEKACTEVIKSNQYSLAANPEEVCASVLVGDSQESIYEIDVRKYWDEIASRDIAYTGALGPLPTHPALTLNSNINGILQDLRFCLVDSVKRLMPKNDLRRNSYFYKFDSLANDLSLKGYAVPNKYRKSKLITSGPNIGNSGGVFQNWVIWRLAGIYLLRAECRVRLGDREGAISDLNIVRQRAKATLYSSAEGDLRYAIFEEKCKKEMLFEPHSYWLDMVRNGYVGVELARFGYTKLSVQDMRDGALFESIYSTEFTNNPLLRQNTYWFKRFGY